MRPWIPTIAVLALFMAPPSQALAATEIGTTKTVKLDVHATIEANERKLTEGDPVFQEERIETSKDSEGEFILKDDTRLAVGPESSITLDRFVYDPDGKTGEIVINAAKGAFRFISGNSAKTAYKINTPATTIGVRGTVFDGFVNDDGELAVLLVEGEIDVCATPGNCRRLNRRGFFYHIRRNGIISNPLKWDGSFFSGVDFAFAFPFVGRRLRIDPVVRFSRRDLLGGRLLRQAPRVVPRTVPRAVPRVRPRVPRFRRPF